MSIIKVLGVDPALSNFGFAMTRVCTDFRKIIAVDHLHLTHTAKNKAKGIKKSHDDLERARALYADLTAFVALADLVVVEVPVGSQSANAMKSVGVCYGLIASIDKPVIEVDPYQVKLHTVGSRTATKEQMIAWATQRYPDANWLRRTLKGEQVLTNANEHLADAVAAVEAAIHVAQVLPSQEDAK